MSVAPAGTPLAPSSMAELMSGGFEPDALPVNPCRICGWTTLPGFDLCVGCLDIQEWSRLNRAFCDFFHRMILPRAWPHPDAGFLLATGAAPGRPGIDEAQRPFVAV